MVTLIEKANDHKTFYGLSTDTKPVKWTSSNINGAHNGDIFVEMNTGNVYLFDETGNTWRAL